MLLSAKSLRIGNSPSSNPPKSGEFLSTMKKTFVLERDNRHAKAAGRVPVKLCNATHESMLLDHLGLR